MTDQPFLPSEIRARATAAARQNAQDDLKQPDPDDEDALNPLLTAPRADAGQGGAPGTGGLGGNPQ